MLTIADSVDIDVPPSTVWSWLCELPEHYLEWHPAHRACVVLQGRPCEPGGVLSIEEELHGRIHRFRMRVVDVTPGTEIAYRATFWLRGRFSVVAVDGRSRFTAQLSLGLPGLGRLLDWPLAHVFSRRIAAARQHQREEAESLKLLLERRAAED